MTQCLAFFVKYGEALTFTFSSSLSYRKKSLGLELLWIQKPGNEWSGGNLVPIPT